MNAKRFVRSASLLRRSEIAGLAIASVYQLPTPIVSIYRRLFLRIGERMESYPEYISLNVTAAGYSGVCPVCDEPLSEGEWVKFGICTCCHYGEIDEHDDARVLA